jgi:hypothetical protein
MTEQIKVKQDGAVLEIVFVHRSITDRTHAKRPSAFWGHPHPAARSEND